MTECDTCGVDLRLHDCLCAEPQDQITAAEYVAMQAKQTTKRKYRNQPTVVDGIQFASFAEARRYVDLKRLQDAGEIESLAVHPRFDLPVAGQHIGRYTADFLYVRDGRIVVEDVKSGPTRTASYRLRKKLMKAIHGIEITEVN